MPRGKLIVFEGLDRAGKSTQCQMLAESLQKDGLKVRHMRFPGTCEFGSVELQPDLVCDRNIKTRSVLHVDQHIQIEQPQLAK
jgi:ABC-type polysaccharide/polyol phosphate transport system ATPase subunit